MHSRLRAAVWGALVSIVLAPATHAQVTDNLGSRAPQFLVAIANSDEPVAAEPATAPLLFERISVDLTNVTLREALTEIAEQSGLLLNYSDNVVPLSRRVRLRAQDITVAAALTEILLDTEVDVLFRSRSEAILVRRPAPPPPPRMPGALLGRVLSAEQEDTVPRPIAGAGVVVEGTSLQEITNEYGVFRFPELPAGTHHITVSSLGHKTATTEVEITEGKTATVMITLEVSPTALAELVVTATGIRRRVELGNDITVINADSIVATEPVTSVTDLLEGRVPGLVVQRSSGAPGDPARIRLRGNSSALLSNDPIVVVDGIRVYADQSSERGGNLAGHAGEGLIGGNEYNYAAPSPLDNIDPNTIERIEVVKGPSAATLYGQDAANGVIVVTTKRGREGPARWSITTEYGTTSVPGEYPELMVRWGRQVTSNTRVLCPVTNRSSGVNAGAEACVPEDIERFQLLNDPDLTILGRGHSTGVSLGVSGGSQALTYNITGSYRDEVGIVELPEYEAERFRAEQPAPVPGWMRRPQNLTRWGASARVTARLGDNADASLQSSLTRTEQQRSSLERQLGTLMSVYLDRETGTYYEISAGTGVRETERPLEGYYERATANATQFTNGVNLNWRPFGWLTATADAGINVIQRSDDVFLPSGLGVGSLVEGRLSVGEGLSLMNTVNLGARAQVPLGAGFSLQVASGVNYTGQSVHDLVTVGRGIPEGTESLNGAAQISQAYERNVDQATFGWYIEPGINHRRFWLSTGLRLDGGSTFGTRLKLPAFPKISASYLISDEAFFPDALSKVFNTLRLRLAYGQAGRQPGPVDRLRLYGATVNEIIDGQTVPTVGLSFLGNTRLKPERSEELEGGFDADLFDDRLSVGVTAYRKTTRDQILSVPVAPSVYGGGINILQNIGTVRNEGFELRLGAEPVRSDFATWSVDVGFAQNRNQVLRLGDGVDPFFTEQNAARTSGIRVAAGYPLFGRWSKPVLGYADGNGDGILQASEVLLGDTMVYVGSTLPDYTAALHSTLSLFNGSLAVSVGLLYEDGMVQRNEVGRRLAPFSRGWNDPNATLEEQAAVFDLTDYMWTQVVNTLRFNSLSVRYQVPGSFAGRIGARALSISLQGTNLGLHTNYHGLDPNVSARFTGNGVVDTGVLPQPRVWQIRVNASY